MPTAPFAEERVYEFVRTFVAARPRLSLTKDRFGNHLVFLPGRSRRPRIVFVAHTDHPGFVARRMTGLRTLECDFRGGVLSEFVLRSKVRFFDDEHEIQGVVTSVTTSAEAPTRPSGATVRVAHAVSPGSPGMFDQGTSRVRGTKLYSRACDDLAGVAAGLGMLDGLLRSRTRPRATVAVLLTRAEEVGFIGALAAVLEPKLLRKDDLIISIECSAMQPYAQQGKGVIVRVGDRTSVFDSSLTYFLTAQAEALAKADKAFKFQRQLMPGGSCEATVFDAYGYTTSAACVALGNYHNMDRAKRKIAPEYIDVNDWRNMVKLFVALARNAHEYEPGLAPLKRRLEKRFNKLKHLF